MKDKYARSLIEEVRKDLGYGLYSSASSFKRDEFLRLKGHFELLLDYLNLKIEGSGRIVKRRVAPARVG